MDDATMTVVCTGRGSHGTITLARIEIGSDGSLTPVMVVEKSRSALERFAKTPLGRRELAADPESYAELRKVANIVKTKTGWRFDCPRCPRDVPFSDQTFAVIAANFPEKFDVSWRG
jgi:hypothetical protein